MSSPAGIPLTFCLSDYFQKNITTQPRSQFQQNVNHFSTGLFGGIAATNLELTGLTLGTASYQSIMHRTPFLNGLYENFLTNAPKIVPTTCRNIYVGAGFGLAHVAYNHIFKK